MKDALKATYWEGSLPYWLLRGLSFGGRLQHEFEQPCTCDIWVVLGVPFEQGQGLRICGRHVQPSQDVTKLWKVDPGGAVIYKPGVHVRNGLFWGVGQHLESHLKLCSLLCFRRNAFLSLPPLIRLRPLIDKPSSLILHKYRFEQPQTLLHVLCSVCHPHGSQKDAQVAYCSPQGLCHLSFFLRCMRVADRTGHVPLCR